MTAVLLALVALTFAALLVRAALKGSVDVCLVWALVVLALLFEVVTY